jgi:hypothetical protein
MRYQIMARARGESRWWPVADADSASQALAVQTAVRQDDPDFQVWCAKVEPVKIDLSVLQ